ncbi:MAG: serine/threonine protein kinase, partial [Elusimicrobiota bacterium]|nr:serine/threonine protein kinase [Elusimicrobiota bacterium]
MSEENKETAPAARQTQGQEARHPAVKANPELALIGQEISGCVILEKISSGGMGTVFKARHKALDRIVCVKILSPALADDKKAVGLFLTEARAIAEIDHPNIVFVYNVGREKGFYFIVMSFIDGESLSSIVRKKPNLPLSFIIDTFIGVLRGLEAAHQKGIIHRDVKPSNILINKNLEPKIVDFGIAKKMDKDKGSTKTTELAGTAYFLSPEQALGRPIDTRADLYSVGASLFYVLTGRYPFTGKNSMDIIQKHINEPVPDVSQYRRGLPTWIHTAVSKLMSKNPEDRFQTAAETLLFFQKMRADDQLKVSQGVNIADEMGLKISNDAPAADETPARTRTNRFNAEVRERAAKTPVHMAALGDNRAA